mgnify:CR=1 FL=1
MMGGAFGLTFGCALMLGNGLMGQAADGDVALNGDLVVRPAKVEAKLALFYTVDIDSKVVVNADKISQTSTLKFKKLQGKDDMMTVALSRSLDDMVVTGEGKTLKAWAVRDVNGKLFLDLQVSDPKVDSLTVIVKGTTDWKTGVIDLMTFGPNSEVKNLGNAGFNEKVELRSNAALAMRAVSASGFVKVKENTDNYDLFVSKGVTKLSIEAPKSDAGFGKADLRNVNLSAVLSEDKKSAVVTLSGVLHVREVDEKGVTLLTGKVGLLEYPDVADVGMNMHSTNGEVHYSLLPKQVGVYPVTLKFGVAVDNVAGWKTLKFNVPNGAVIPLSIDAVGDNAEFRKSDLGKAASVTELQNLQGKWQGVLSASGVCMVQWKQKSKSLDGELFYTSNGVADIRIGAGLMNSVTTVRVKILQGKMSKLVMTLDGEGEIMSVIGSQVASWKVTEVAGKRVLECILNSARSEVGAITVAAQYPLGKLPAKVQPLRLTPQGAIRHSGYVRVKNDGAVRLESTKVEGLLQLSPDLFPGAKRVKENPKVQTNQVFVYRYPTAERGLEISADQIISEVGVSQVLVYELGDTDRVIYADIELDIREAALREWSFKIPADYAVSAVKGAEMADYVVSTTVENGQRNLKIIFKNEVIGRQLVQLKLEKNLAATAGDWTLARLKFPGAITVKGDIGIQAAHGWKVTETKIEGLKSRALAYFPKRSEILQHAYRVRSDDWSVAVKVEEMGQSVQADLFHLYELKEGMLEAKVLVNYFVIGAPSNQWNLALPLSAENVSVEGQNVRSWDYKEGQLVVNLHQPSMGAATLLVTYEEAMPAGGGTIELGGVTPLNVQSESGFIHLVSGNQVKHQVLKGKQIPLTISPLEMPRSFQVLNSKPSIAAWQYASRPFGLKLEVETLELVDTVDQVIGAATLSTKVTRSGEVVTSAKFLVSTRGKKALRIRLPANNQLWSAKADNKMINARVDGGEYILPIPATTDPNRYRVLEIRYGGTSDDPKSVVVGPPVLSAPMTIAEWKISGDNHLMVTGGNVKPLQTVIQETGFDWISGRMSYLTGVLALLLGGILLTRKFSDNHWLLGFGMVWLFSVVLFSAMMVFKAANFDVQSLKEFNVVAPVVEGSEVVSLELRNSASSLGIFSSMGVVTMLLGFVGFVVCNLKSLPTVFKALAIVVVSIGALMHVGGASYFYFIIALVSLILLVLAVNDFRSKWDGFKQQNKRSKLSKVKSTGATAVLALVMSLAGQFSANADNVANSISESWNIQDDQLRATMNVKWTAKVGQSVVVLRQPATLVSHSGDGYRIVKVQKPKTKQIVWSIVAEKEGEINVNLTYQMAMPNPADQAWLVPSGLAAVKNLTVNVAQKNWQVTATNSVQVKQISAPSNAALSSASLVLIGNLQSSVILKPMPRNRGNEKLRFFAEMADIYIPAAGVLDGRHKLKIRPLSGQLSELVLDVPAGMMVGDVLGNVVDSWRFDAKKQTLTVTLQSALSQEFELNIMTQRGLKAFPQQVMLETMKVRGVDNVVGMLGYGFGSDSQPDDAKVTNLLEVNSSDFDAGLIKQAKALQPAYVLHKAYRYGKDYGKVDLKIAAVAPEIRVQSRQVLRMNEEQISLQIEATVNITRAGIFDLKFAIPNGFTVETVGGSALRDWSENEVDGKRVVTMFLNGKTMGEQRFVVTMIGASPKGKKFTVPQWELDNVERQKGVLMIVPDHGIRLQVKERNNVSQLDLSKNGQDQQGALSFRLLQKGWKLQLAVQKLDAWVTAEMLQELSLKEGVTNKRLRIIFNVENAVVKSFRLRLTGVAPTDEKGKTLRASGAVVKDMIHVKDDIWEIRLKQGVIGKVPVTVEYQEVADRKENKEVIAPVILLDVKQVQHYVVVRAPGRLDMQQTAAVRSWRAIDWSRVPVALHNPADKSVPSMSYKLTDAEKPLTVMVKRHAMAGTLKLRVEKAEMRTLFNVDGSALTRLSMDVKVVEKSRLRVTLPTGSELFNVIVNDESVAVVKEDDAYWFLIDSSANDSLAAKVKVTYLTDVPANGSQNKVKLFGPSLNIPLEKIDWFVMLPDGYDYSGFNGGFDFVELQNLGSQNYVRSYVAKVKTRYQRLKAEGQKELEMAMNWSNSGELDKANKAFNRVYQNGAVDAASNEDAKVKLERNMTSQAIMGLNTRRQRIYMDNQAAGNQIQRNNLLEEAATNNPFFAGTNNFDPNQLNNYMQGNSQEEINAMSRIAKKLVGTQINAGNTSRGIDLEMLDSSKVLHVYRDVYLPGENDLVLEVNLKDAVTTSKGVRSSFGLIALLLIVGALGGWILMSSKKAA